MMCKVSSKSTSFKLGEMIGKFGPILRGELSSKLAYITIHEEGRDSTDSPVDGKALWQSFLKECSYLVEAALIMQFTYINLFPKKKYLP